MFVFPPFHYKPRPIIVHACSRMVRHHVIAHHVLHHCCRLVK